MLEPYALKGACTVLRGGGEGNLTSLPDYFYSRSNSAAVLVTSTDREFNTRRPAGSSLAHLLSGGDLHDTGRRARRGRAAGRLPRALCPALRQGAGPTSRLRLPQGADGLPRPQEHRADRPAGRPRRRLGLAE